MPVSGWDSAAPEDLLPPDLKKNSVSDPGSFAEAQIERPPLRRDGEETRPPEPCRRYISCGAAPVKGTERTPPAGSPTPCHGPPRLPARDGTEQSEPHTTNAASTAPYDHPRELSAASPDALAAMLTSAQRAAFWVIHRVPGGAPAPPMSSRLWCMRSCRAGATGDRYRQGKGCTRSPPASLPGQAEHPQGRGCPISLRRAAPPGWGVSLGRLLPQGTGLF